MPTETVVITGASAGVGRATAQAFAKRGARLGLLARGVDRLNATAAKVRAAGSVALVLPTDVADADADLWLESWLPRQSGLISAGIGSVAAMAVLLLASRAAAQ